MLPLPLLEVPAFGKGGAQRSRRGSLRAVTRVANGALCALHSLLGYGVADAHSIPGLSRCALHESVRAEVLERSLLFEPASNAPGSSSEEAALKELLRGRSVYEVGQVGCAVKPYGSGPVSLPKYLDNCLRLEDSLPSEYLLFLEGNHERVRNPDPELVGIKPYFDVVLERNRRNYVRFIR